MIRHFEKNDEDLVITKSQISLLKHRENKIFSDGAKLLILKLYKTNDNTLFRRFYEKI